MLLKKVLLCCNNNPLYYDYYPYVKKMWKNVLNIDCILIFVGNTIPDILLPYKEDIILFEPFDNINDVFIAQNIRLLYPALIDTEDGVMIADIDIVPLSKDCFIKEIEPYENKFIVLTHNELCDKIKEYYMCYNVAPPKIWSEVFNIKNIDDIKNTLKLWYGDIVYEYNKYRSKCKGFHNDQQMLYKYLQKYDNKILITSKIKRFNIQKDINDTYDDYHIPKPFHKYSKLNYKILNKYALNN